MRLQWFGYYMDYDGYGRFNSRMVRALQNEGVHVKPATITHYTMPSWLQEQEGLNWNALSISCMAPYMVQSVPGRHWLFTMTEGSMVSPQWVENIKQSGVERLLVPCSHNVEAFYRSGIELPITVIPGGTDPVEFPLVEERPDRPYTFLTLADRGDRKGWKEVWEAFYRAFGGKTSGDPSVRLVIKTRVKNYPTTIQMMSNAKDGDPRIIYQIDSVDDMYGVLVQADCVVLPSRSEGWGMIHREAACMGLPVITQRYSGLDDGFAEEWAIPLTKGKIAPVPKEYKDLALGEWMVADIEELATAMKDLKENPELGVHIGLESAIWIRNHQTWGHSARELRNLVEGVDGTLERRPVPLAV